jgi:aryl-alcohol dehydrogenase-like predicted oxidoreductase
MGSLATPAATAAYAQRFAAELPAAHFQLLDGLTVSSIGLGTYLGDADDASDAGYHGAIVDALPLGCNLFDTAINYRAQRSERVLGRALGTRLGDGSFARSEIVVCTKGGYLPFDGRAPVDPSAYVRDTYVRPGILRAEDIVGGGHAMTPRYLKDQLGRSLANLGLAAVDVYYLHNPETQLAAVPRAEFRTRIRAAFTWLEEEVAAGRVGRYGVATWSGLRRAPREPDHLSLAELVAEAESVAGAAHHFKVTQLPYNLALPEAYTTPTQLVDGEPVSVIEAARRLGVAVVASASILQGELAGRLPPGLATALPGLTTSAQQALQFVRSTRGITAALVGMGRREHVRENLAVARIAPAPAGVDSLFERR